MQAFTNEMDWLTSRIAEVYIPQFLPISPFYAPWKLEKTSYLCVASKVFMKALKAFIKPFETPKKVWFSGVFKGYKIGILTKMG